MGCGSSVDAAPISDNKAQQNDVNKGQKQPNKTKDVIKFNSINKWKSLTRDTKTLISKLQNNELFNDANFKYFKKPTNNRMETIQDDIETDIRWMRPNEIVPTAIIGLHNIKPEDVRQGALNDGWFISTISAIARYPQLIRKIFPGEQTLYGVNYKGFVRVCFWIYGEWVEIYIDDKLPTRHGNLIYGQCKSPSNFWVPLLEKAYAKFLGTYEELIDGQNERALIDLTGAFTVSFNSVLNTLLPLRYRIEDVIADKYPLVACTALSNETGFDSNSYSVHAINKFLSIHGSQQRIYTLRSSFGTAKEKDRLESNNPVWSKIDDITKQKIMYDDNDTFSWMDADHIRRQFNKISLAYFIPQLSQNPKLFEFINRWRAIDDIITPRKCLNFPHYLLLIKGSANKTDKVDVVVNLLQEEHQRNNNFEISLVLFPVRQVDDAATVRSRRIGTVNYEILPKCKFVRDRQRIEIFTLLPGYYILAAAVKNLNLESLVHLLRIFSYSDIEVEELTFNKEDNSKFLTKENRYINVVIFRCAFCEQFIEGEHVASSKFYCHSDCATKFRLCDSCGEVCNTHDNFEMDNGLHFCKRCYGSFQNRIKSAEQKYLK